MINHVKPMNPRSFKGDPNLLPFIEGDVQSRTVFATHILTVSMDFQSQLALSSQIGLIWVNNHDSLT